VNSLVCQFVCFLSKPSLSIFLPLAFPVLFRTETFEAILAKVIDWFLLLREKDGILSSKISELIKAALISVRQSKEFSKAVLWTRVVIL